MDLRSKFRGSLLGTGIGDSLGRTRESGSITEGKNIESIAAEKDLLRYTDDTQQMIGLAESLAERGKFDGPHFAERLVENFDPQRGYGPGSIQVIEALEEGEEWYKPARRLFGGEGSYGNGSSMRTAPAGLFCHDNLANLRSFVRDCSRITHSHRLGVEGAVLQSFSIAFVTGLDPSEYFDPEEFLKEVGRFVEEDEFIEKLEVVGEMIGRDTDRVEIVRKLGNGVESFNSVPTAIYSFLSHPNNFSEAVTYAVSLGGDADTIGAMTGAIAGAYHGEEGIPGEWVEKLEDREKIVELADRLLQAKE